VFAAELTSTVVRQTSIRVPSFLLFFHIFLTLLQRSISFRKLPATGWTAGIRFPTDAGIYFFVTTSRPALGPAPPLNQWAPWTKRPRREADHSLLSSRGAELKLHYIRLPRVVLKQRGNLAFTFTFVCVCLSVSFFLILNVFQ
jgi:hypothetical protein